MPVMILLYSILLILLQGAGRLLELMVWKLHLIGFSLTKQFHRKVIRIAAVHNVSN